MAMEPILKHGLSGWQPQQEISPSTSTTRLINIRVSALSNSSVSTTALSKAAMAEVSELTDIEKNFLEPYLPPGSTSRRGEGAGTDGAPEECSGATNAPHVDDGDLPFVTLTYASSLDSMISLAPGLRTTLSGPETKSMTHYLRIHHDAILVGVGTAIPDDPGLNSRYPGVTLDSQPRPVVVDPKMRWNVYGSKLAQLAQAGQGKAPWLIHTPREVREEPLTEWGGKRVFLATETGYPSQKSEPAERETIAWPVILKMLRREGANSVMIEGGASVISTLLSMPELVDSVIVTIAPTWLGEGGVTVSPAPKTEAGERVNAARLQQTAWRQFGADAVLCGRLQASKT
ncbi:hypothetical protein LTR85_003912 [Meristemomyces frigidus]|nr:hypothetical protein LTR85_003912 [Meristemomyces frigidus]